MSAMMFGLVMLVEILIQGVMSYLTPTKTRKLFGPLAGTKWDSMIFQLISISKKI